MRRIFTTEKRGPVLEDWVKKNGFQIRGPAFVIRDPVDNGEVGERQLLKVTILEVTPRCNLIPGVGDRVMKNGDTPIGTWEFVRDGLKGAYLVTPFKDGGDGNA